MVDVNPVFRAFTELLRQNPDPSYEKPTIDNDAIVRLCNVVISQGDEGIERLEFLLKYHRDEFETIPRRVAESFIRSRSQSARRRPSNTEPS